MTTIDKGACVCGTPVQRERMEGVGASRFNALPFVCEPCDLAQVAEWAAQDQQDRDREAAAEQKRRVSYSGLPPALARVELDRLTGNENVIAAGRYWAQRGGGLMLTGPFGTGKTTIAAGAFLLVLERRAARWTSAPLLMAHLGSGFDSDQRARALSTLQGTGPLVIDDLDKTRPTEYGAEQIFLAVDGAVTSGRALLVTTNLGLGQLAGKWPQPFGEAIASRLAGYCEVVTVGGADRRLEGRAA